MVIVYLAGPIDQQGDQAWRDEVIRKLAGEGFTIFCPYAAFNSYSPWHMVNRDAGGITSINRHAILSSHLVFALVNPRAFGTIREIEFARANDVPTVVWDPEARLSLSVEAQDLTTYIDRQNAIDYAVAISKTIVVQGPHARR